MISSGYQRLGRWYADKINRRYFPEFADEVAREIIAGVPFNLLPLSVGGGELQEFARRSTSRKTLIDYYKSKFPELLESTERALLGEPMFYGISMDDLPSQLKEEYLLPILRGFRSNRFFSRVYEEGKEKDLTFEDIDRIFLEQFKDFKNLLVEREGRMNLLGFFCQIYELDKENKSRANLFGLVNDLMIDFEFMIDQRFFHAIFGDLERKVS